jgi:ribosomal-protein-alanine N-acetyltransferase
MALEQEQQGIAACFLEVREDNLGAIALYEQAGYVKTGRRPAYYQDGCAAVLYHKDRVRAQVL